MDPRSSFYFRGIEKVLKKKIENISFRSQLEYETFLENYELNQYFHLNMVGISAFQKSSECTSVLYRVVSVPHPQGS